MATYPTELKICLGSVAIPRASIRIDLASNGDVKGQRVHSSDRYDFRLIHSDIDAADKTTLDTFFTTNKALELTLTWIDSVGYNCIFRGRPIYTSRGMGLYNVEVNLAQKDV